MKIISFAYTTDALLAGEKTVSRRYWTDNHANRFQPGELVQAWDKRPSFGGKKVAEIKIIAVYKENMVNAPDEDYEKEGFAYMLKNGMKCAGEETTMAYWRAWKGTREDVWVVRFELVRKV